MPITNPSVKTGVTSYTVTGGTALSLAVGAQDIDTLKFIVSSDTSLKTRRELQVDIVAPKVQASAPNGFTQARWKSFMKFPRTLANTKTTVDTIRLEFATDIETSSTQKGEMYDALVTFLADSSVKAAILAQTL